MPTALDKATLQVKSLSQRFVAWCGTLSRRTLTLGGLGFGLLSLLGVNLIASDTLRGFKADLTQDGLYSIAPGTRKVLRGIGEPINIRVYFSQKLGEASPQHAKYFQRVRSLLEQYRDISGGRVELAFLDPEPFSDAEDRAVAAGLRGIALNRDGDMGYFGLVATNSTDNESSIPFMAPDRQAFLEYDLTKLVFNLANPKKRVVGMIAGVPIEGGMAPMMNPMQPPQQTPPWIIMEQIREFFEVRTLTADIKEVPAEVEVLMLVQPDGLTRQAAYAIDQFALRGGRVIVFADPVAEMARMNPMMGMAQGKNEELDRLLKSWGVAFDPEKVAGDRANARRVQFGRDARQQASYVAWIALGKGAIDQKDILSAGVEVLNFASAGVLEKAEKATTTFTPLIQTSTDAQKLESARLRMQPDVVGLFNSFKSEGKALTIAARVSGEAKSAFPDGRPKEEEKKDDKKADDKPSEDKKAEEKKVDEKAPDPATVVPAKEAAKKEEPKKEAAKKAEPAKKEEAAKKEEPKKDEPKKDEKPEIAHVASGKINALIFADSDFLFDHFWVEAREFLGQQVLLPQAQNGALVVNAIDNMLGGDSLIELRSRGVTDRPFEVVRRIRTNAESRFRQKEQTLITKLKGMQEQLQKVETKGEGGTILTDKERQDIEKFRAEMLGVRRELRDVKHELRKDIDNLEWWLKVITIAGVPLLIGLGGLGFTYLRRRPRPKAA